MLCNEVYVSLLDKVRAGCFILACKLLRLLESKLGNRTTFFPLSFYDISCSVSNSLNIPIRPSKVISFQMETLWGVKIFLSEKSYFAQLTVFVWEMGVLPTGDGTRLAVFLLSRNRLAGGYLSPLFS